MGITFALFLLGLIFGAGIGDGFGAVAWGGIGLLVGLGIHAVLALRARTMKIDPIVERHQLMCFPYAQEADCELVGDRRTGRWVDVKSCSHLPEGRTCDQGCLHMMNHRPSRPGVESVSAA